MKKIFICEKCSKKIEEEIQTDNWFVVFCENCYNYWRCGFYEPKSKSNS